MAAQALWVRLICDSQPICLSHSEKAKNVCETNTPRKTPYT